MIPVVVFAKVPLPGIAKTRIAAAAGQDAADRIYRELLTLTSRTVEALPHHVAYTGHENPQDLETIFPAALSFFSQHDGTLGERMQGACMHLLAQDTPGVIIIGCDCPARTAADLHAAVHALEHGADAVIGPATDGGYHLIGCTQLSLDIFDARGWGMPTLFDETMEIIGRRGYRVELVRTLSDVDTIEDYNRWRTSIADRTPGSRREMGYDWPQCDNTGARKNISDDSMEMCT